MLFSAEKHVRSASGLGGRTRPIDSASPVVVGTPPPTTPSTFRRGAPAGTATPGPMALPPRGVGDDVLPAQLLKGLQSERVSPAGTAQERARVLAASGPPSGSVADAQIDSFAHLLSTTSRTGAQQQPLRANSAAVAAAAAAGGGAAARAGSGGPMGDSPTRLELLVKAAMGPDQASRQRLFDDISRLVAEQASKKSPTPPAVAPSPVAAPALPPDDPVVAIIAAVRTMQQLQQQQPPAGQAPAAAAAGPQFPPRLSSVAPTSGAALPQRPIPQPELPQLVMENLRSLERGVPSSRRRLLKSEASAFSDATNERSDAPNGPTAVVVPASAGVARRGHGGVAAHRDPVLPAAATTAAVAEEK